MSTHHQGTGEERAALDVYIKLSRAANAVTNRINAHLADVNLTISQFGVLESLYHLGPMHQNVLGEKILKSSGNMTLVIDNLVKRGLVERRRDEQDRRYIQVYLTEAGKELIDDIFPRHVKIVVNEMQILSSAEKKQLARLCRKVGLQDM
ncbi:MAG: MarR family transcriptional regulator [Chloroflexi bacterium]|nr:MAG: MarR family transcriptional regulator [Chloroflexota bacterium]